MYRTICTELWTDPKVRQLSVSGKLLFVYLITNPHTHLSGLYYLPRVILEEETGLTGRGFDGAWKGLLDAHFIEHDAEREQVWVVNMFRFQGKGHKTERGVAYHLTGLHKSPLITRFLEHYPQIRSHLPADFSGYPIDAPSEGHGRFPSPNPVPSSVPDPEKRGKGRNNGASEFPKGWQLTEEQEKQAVLLGLNAPQEFAKFRDYHQARGTRFKDWGAAWRNWTRKAEEIKHGLPKMH